jgi:hypothetical protein
MNSRSAIAKINKAGALLVFPIKNSPEPDSLWAQFFPKKKMKWEWDDNGDGRVGDLWLLMKRLSAGREVVYSKWYQGRATFFSKALFTAMLALQNREAALTPAARSILEILQTDSPLSTKEIKVQAELRGKFNEPTYNKAMKELFSKLLIIAFGEVDDGAFPSLAVGATALIYEDLWNDSQALSPAQALEILDQEMPVKSKFRTFFDAQLRSSK